MTAPLKRSDSVATDLETAFLRQPFLEQRLERTGKQRTARKWLRFDSHGLTSVVHQDKLQIAEQTGIQVLTAAVIAVPLAAHPDNHGRPQEHSMQANDSEAYHCTLAAAGPAAAGPPAGHVVPLGHSGT